MRYFIYGNGGGIDKVQEELKKPKETFWYIKDVFEKIIKDCKGDINIKDLSLHYYCYDPRIKRDVYMICTNRRGEENYIKKYGGPQFMKYLIYL